MLRTRKVSWLAFIVFICAAFIYGVAVGAYRIFPASLLRTAKHKAAVDGADAAQWDAKFSRVQIPARDGTKQAAYFFAGKPGAPVVISLHSWSGGYAQADPLADLVVARGWTYLHPDFRGANWSPQACLSPAALADLSDAIRFATAKGDPARVFVFGGSGGAYAALGAYLTTHERVNTVMAWNPISDLTAWHAESLAKHEKYADDIERCAGDNTAARSPLAMTAAPGRTRLELFAGLNDGHDGSVPISHSLRFFNRLAAPSDRLPEGLEVDLLSRNVAPTGQKIGGRAVYFQRSSGNVTLTVFEGEHEALYDYADARLAELAGAR